MTKTTTIDPKLIDQLLEQTPTEDLLAENGLIKQFAKAILERALQAEMTTHLGHEPGESLSNEAGNKRNGTTSQTVQGELGFLALQQHLTGLGRKLEISIPLDPEHAPDGQGHLETVKALLNRNWSKNARLDCAVWTPRL